MSYVIGYEDKKQESTMFLSKRPKPNTGTVEWAPNLSKSHPFDSLDEAQGIIDESLRSYDGVYILNIPMSRE